MYVIEQTEAFQKWLYGLKDTIARDKIRLRIQRASKGNFGDWKPVGGEVREMRIDRAGGYRIYYTIRGETVVFLLHGGGKTTQRADIEKAKKIAEAI